MNNFTTGFKAFSSQISHLGAELKNVDLNGTSSKLTKSFQTLNQTLKERTGGAEDITELPQEYLDLERRVDGLKAAHVGFLRVAKVYDYENYDYPTQLQESVTEIGSTIQHNLTFWANAATKGTNLPQPAVSEKPAEVHKTLPHALARAAASAAIEVQPGKLSTALKTYAVAQDSVGAARVAQDEDISKNFLQPWSATLHSSLSAAIKSRANVKSARISLDASRAVLKNSTGGPKQEQARMEVEASEETLVLATESAINLMRAVLENPEPIKNLASLIKAQQAFYAQSADILATVQGEVETAAHEAEAEYRKSRAQ